MKTVTFKLEFDPEIDDTPSLSTPDIQNQLQKIYNQIHANKNIESLAFTSSWLSAIELAHLTKIISEHTNLKVVNLNHNSLGNASVDILKKIVIDHPKLEALYLDDNDIDDNFIINLLKNATNNFKQQLLKLEKISFQNNNITEKGFELIKEHFSPQTALTVLVGNKLKLDSAEIEKNRKELIDRIGKETQSHENIFPNANAVASKTNTSHLAYNNPSTEKNVKTNNDAATATTHRPVTRSSTRKK